jgi:hypothetical protein
VIRRLALIVLLVSSVTQARAAAPSSAAPQPAKVPSAGMTPDAAAQIPEARKLEIADQDLKTIRKTVDRVAARAEEARLEKDVGKLNCLNAQLTQMKGLGKVAAQANDALVDAVGKKDSATSSSQFARIVIATDKVVSFGSEADVCLGQLAYLIDGKTSVDVEQPEGLPGQDVTVRTPAAAAFATPPIVRPPPASKFY